MFNFVSEGAGFASEAAKRWKEKELPEYRSALTCAPPNAEVLIPKRELGKPGREAGGKEKKYFFSYMPHCKIARPLPWVLSGKEELKSGGHS